MRLQKSQNISSFDPLYFCKGKLTPTIINFLAETENFEEIGITAITRRYKIIFDK